MMRSLLLALALFPAVAFAQDPFAAAVRTTEPLSPADEQKTLRVPPGFEVQLVAAEPDIQKPLNMAFDDRGRLWLTDSVEYPRPVPVDQPGRDTIKILEDTDGDGRADKITTFADGLNIPMGLYPYKDGVIAFSIPYIWHLRDTNGDGRCDVREKLYGPMGYERDTHGMNNAFRRGFDGWLYACHGFNNETRVKGTDGHEIHMQSGNTYRMRLDGSRVEHFTWGQVNPFGMTFDPLGNLFTADCHSKPIYQLLRNGYYPSFGKPHDGLGFVPPMMDHLHGSTAIAGVASYDSGEFPPEYRGNMFSGNVMTSRVNRNSLVFRGATIRAKEEPDFVVSDDPWFRPADVQLGPDGALYVSDFYNRIIGHYEVPLDHPGRDRTSGRIWRIVYRGVGQVSQPAIPDRQAGKPAPHQPRDLTRLSIDQLLAALDDANQTYRLLALNRLVDAVGSEAAPAIAKAFAGSTSGRLRSHALWALFRLNALTDEQLESAAKDQHREPRVHAMKVLAEMPRWSELQRRLALTGLQDADPFVRLAAADALARHPAYEQIRPLMDALAAVPTKDALLKYQVRLSLRNQLRPEENLTRLQQSGMLTEAERQTIAQITLAVPTPAAAEFLTDYLRRNTQPLGELARYVPHAARYAAEEKLPTLIAVARTQAAGNPDQQMALLNAVQNGLDQRGLSAVPVVQDWAQELVQSVLDSPTTESLTWTNEPLPGQVVKDDPWVVQPRRSKDGDTDSLFFGSLPRGEHLTGILRSQPFALPERLSFYLAGHIGPPGQPVEPKNFVRLRDAETHALLKEVKPPRNDVAQLIEWNLEEFAGKNGYLELVDGDDGRAYAWLAAGRFSLESLNPSRDVERRGNALSAIGRFRLNELRPRLVEFAQAEQQDVAIRAAAVQALVTLEPDARLTALLPVFRDVPAAVQAQLAEAIVARQPDDLQRVAADVMRAIPERKHLAVAEALAGNAEGADLLLRLVEQGQTSARLLVRPSVKLRLAALKQKAMDERVANLAANLPDENETLKHLIASRQKSFRGAEAQPEHGAEIFTKTCAACHQLEGRGALVGPQLDGIGNRGLERLMEDVLDPNRNVDVAFRVTTLILSDGRVVSGLLRRAEGAELVLVDNQGKEFTVPEADVEERQRTTLSLMPANVGETLPEPDFRDLMAYLLTKRAASPPKSE